MQNLPPIRQTLKLFTLAILIGVSSTACDKQTEPPQHNSSKPTVVVAASWIAVLTADLLGETAELVSLVPPGNCPGHFDLSPGQLRSVRQAKLAICFDFQKNIQHILSDVPSKPIDAIVLNPLGGLSVPATYSAAAAFLADQLTGYFPDQMQVIAARLQTITSRMNDLATMCRSRAQACDFNKQRILTSEHQKAFCEFLQCQSTAPFGNAAMENPAVLNQLLTQAQADGVTLVVANAQEGTQLAQALAAHLNIPLAVLSNFPNPDQTFEAFVLANLDAVEAALQAP